MYKYGIFVGVYNCFNRHFLTLVAMNMAEIKAAWPLPGWENIPFDTFFVFYLMFLEGESGEPMPKRVYEWMMEHVGEMGLLVNIN